MAGRILSWLFGRGIESIGAQLNRAYETRMKAKNDRERVQAEKEIAHLQARYSVLVAEQGHWMTRWIRPAFALPFVIYDFKVIVWDKVLGWGTTDALAAEFWQLQMIVFGAYFLTRPLEKKKA